VKIKILLALVAILLVPTVSYAQLAGDVLNNNEGGRGRWLRVSNSAKESQHIEFTDAQGDTLITLDFPNLDQGWVGNITWCAGTAGSEDSLWAPKADGDSSLFVIPPGTIADLPVDVKEGQIIHAVISSSGGRSIWARADANDSK